jgi:hypothetical protein
MGTGGGARIGTGAVQELVEGRRNWHVHWYRFFRVQVPTPMHWSHIKCVGGCVYCVCDVLAVKSGRSSLSLSQNMSPAPMYGCHPQNDDS